MKKDQFYETVSDEEYTAISAEEEASIFSESANLYSDKGNQPPANIIKESKEHIVEKTYTSTTVPLENNHSHHAGSPKNEVIEKAEPTDESSSSKSDSLESSDTSSKPQQTNLKKAAENICMTLIEITRRKPSQFSIDLNIQQTSEGALLHHKSSNNMINEESEGLTTSMIINKNYSSDHKDDKDIKCVIESNTSECSQGIRDEQGSSIIRLNLSDSPFKEKEIAFSYVQGGKESQRSEPGVLQRLLHSLSTPFSSTQEQRYISVKFFFLFLQD